MAAAPPTPYQPAGFLHGIVKQVLSGDTLVIMSADQSRFPPPEKQVSLAYLTAPRLGNRGKNEPDQPFAWRAREFLRTWLIGKPVSFRVDYAHPNGRSFATVVTADDGTNVAAAVVAEGLARVFPPKGFDTANADASTPVGQLLELEQVARAEGKGQWTSDEGAAARETRAVDYAPDTKALVEAHGRNAVTAVVEHVLGGASFKVLLLPSYQNVTLLLAGVQAPAIRRNQETGEEDAQEFAREARHFSEARVLHRTVRVILEATDKSGNVLGSLLHVTNDINLGVELVKAGYARVVDWSAQHTAAAPLLRAAEAGAKSQRLCIWRNYVAPNAAPGMGEYNARVVEVVGPDVLVVTTAPVGTPNAEERRLYLSSVKAPRPGNERRGEKGEPYAYEGREWLRRNAVGRKVRVVPEFQRKLPAQEAVAGADGAPGTRARPEVDRVYAAVFVNDRNLAEGLIAQGLAEVNHGRSSDDRSAYYDLLLDAERMAKEKKVGKHSSRPPTALTPADCQDLASPDSRERAKAFLPALQRDPRVRGIILYVIHGARFKVLVPKESCIIALSLAGVRCPATSRRDQPGSVAEPFADEALALARHVLHQRDVEIEVESLEKNGVFLGFVHTLDTKKNYAVDILEQGLARRIPPAADRSKYALQLEAAERHAINMRLRIWENYEEKEEEAEEPEELPAEGGRRPPPLQEIDLHGTDVTNGVSFYAQPCGADDSAPSQARRIQEVLAGGSANGGFTPKVGATCAALFSQDGAFYRAKVLSVNREANTVAVQFVDYGNGEVCTSLLRRAGGLRAHGLPPIFASHFRACPQDVAIADCRPLDPTISTTAIPPLAMSCKLAYLVAQPVDDDFGEEAAHTLSDAVLGRSVRALVERKQGNEAWVSVLKPEPSSDTAGGSGSSGPSGAGDTDSPSKVLKTLNADLVRQVNHAPEAPGAMGGDSVGIQTHLRARPPTCRASHASSAALRSATRTRGRPSTPCASSKRKPGKGGMPWRRAPADGAPASPAGTWRSLPPKDWHVEMGGR